MIQLFLGICSNSFPLNLLLVLSYQAYKIIIKRLIQGRNNVTRVRVEPRSCDRRLTQSCKSGRAFRVGFGLEIDKMLGLTFVRRLRFGVLDVIKA